MSVEFDRISTRDMLGSTVAELAAEDDTILYLFGDTKGVGGKPMQSKYPDRGLNVGIAEQNMALMAAGMATCGAQVFIVDVERVVQV